MRSLTKKLLALVAAGALLVQPALAAGIPTLPIPGIVPPLDPGNLLSYFQALVQNVNQYASDYQSLNYLDNGAMLVDQRGTGAQTCGGTSGPTETAYSADRWACVVNVGSQQGKAQVVTSAAGVTFAPGFSNMVSLYRNANALTQPVCLEQFVESARFTYLQGHGVILSAYLANNAGAPGGNTATMYLWTGTGSNEGLGDLRGAVGMTASPALTPALTGLATAGSYTTPALTTTTTRYSSGPIQVPATATEGVVAICWTPGTETAGSTDGILIGGVQAEEAEPAQTTAGRFERIPLAEETIRAQRFYAQLNEPASGAAVPITMQNVASATQQGGWTLPTTMQAVPTLVVSAAGTFKLDIAGTATTWTTPTASTCSTFACAITASTTDSTVGNIGGAVTGGGGSGILYAGSDF